MTKRLPTMLVTGFLGTGKTTLLNHVLRNAGGRRLGVLVNDFGELSIDGQLVESLDENTVALAGGCMCCEIRDDVPRAVSRLLARADRLDHLLVEASGVSNPFEAARPLVQLAPAIALEGVIGVVDAERLVSIEGSDGHVDWSDLVIDHVMAADIVVLNKVDLVTDAQLARARELAREAVSRARLLEAIHAQVPVELLLGTDHRLRAELPAPAGHTHPGYEAWRFCSAIPLHADRFRETLRSLPPTVIRGKGSIVVTGRRGSTERLLLQLVGSRVELGPWPAPSGTETVATRPDAPRTDLVLIGPHGGLDPDQLQARLEACVATA